MINLTLVVRSLMIFKLNLMCKLFVRGLLILLACTGSQVMANELPFVILAPFEQGVLDGSEPFALTDDCNAAGDDCNDSDGRVRTNDTLEFSWSVTVGGLSPANNSGLSAERINSVMFEQTLSPVGNAVFEIVTLPAACLGPPVGSGGHQPPSHIQKNTDGSTTLLCNLGSAGNGEQKSFSVAVRPLIQSANLSGITSRQAVYGLDQVGNRLTAEYAIENGTTYEISAAPAYDLVADRSPLTLGDVTVQDIGNGPEPGYAMLFTAHIATDPDKGVLGQAELGDSVSFNPDVNFTSAEGQLLDDTNWSLLDCRSNKYEWGSSVFGDGPYALDLLQYDAAVSDSGDCTITGNRPDGYSVQVNGIDSSGSHYPARTIGGESLVDGPYFVSSLSLEVFVPFSEIDKADNVTDDNTGSVIVQACLSSLESSFEPPAPNGQLNYLDGVEPAQVSGNNCTGNITARLKPDGDFSVRNVSSENDEATLTSYQPLISSSHAGDGLLEPGQAFGTLAFYKNTGSTPLTEFALCSVFDNTVVSLTDRADIGATPGTFAYTGIYTFAGSHSAASSDTGQWAIEYGVAKLSGDDPLSPEISIESSRDRVSGRYTGRWNKLSKLRCDGPAFTWFSDPVLAGVDEVNAVRLVPSHLGTGNVNDGSGTLDIGQEIRLVTPLTAREHFYGGAHDNKVIPNGTIAAAFGSWRSTERYPLWRDNRYDPLTGSGSADGDRMTISRIKLDLEASTVLPAAEPGTDATSLAGNPVVWQILPLPGSSFDGEVANDLSLFVTLSAGSSYNAGCTLAAPMGRPPTSIRASSVNPALTELVFELGDMQAGQAAEPVQICVDTLGNLDAELKSGATAQINTYLRADNAVTSATENQLVYLDDSGALFASVDADKTVIVSNEPIQLTLQLRNLGNVNRLAKPALIYVLPFEGDGEGDAARLPASRLDGRAQLTNRPEVTYRNLELIENANRLLRYTKDDPTTLSHNAVTDNANWCYFGNDGFYSLGNGINCPVDWSQVTAIRFDSPQDLGLRGEATDGYHIALTIEAPEAKSGSSLNNVFGVSSASFTQQQVLIARPTLVSVVSFSIEGTVFASFNGDLDYDQGIDWPVPDGTPILLLDADSREILQTSLTSNGYYDFPQLASGRYQIGLAESLFDASGILPLWVPATAAAGEPGLSDSRGSNEAFQGFTTATVELNPELPEHQPNPNPVVDLALRPTDADADGIPDIEEYGNNKTIIDAVDTDGDGTADYIDTDSDGDGIEDSIEGHADTDGDGIANHIDQDSDADGIPDAVEGNTDSDQDNLPDYIDGIDSRDADGDTIPDTIEGLDVNNSEPGAGATDSDGDGLPDGLDLDSDNDGIADSIELTADTDRDGLPNYIDTDSDSDGILDITEGLVDANQNQVPDYLENNRDPDTDGDGIADVLEGAGDSDSDGKPDIIDTDSDGDGIPDSVETVIDTDADGTPNYIDRDSDNDGISDRTEGAGNRDSDERPDYLDLDSDNDSRSDLLETAGSDNNQDGKLDVFIDNNRDGEHDPLVNSIRKLTDTDFDGVFDFIDSDSDNDGIPDLIESRGADSDEDRDGQPDLFIDSNRDGLNEHASSTRLIEVDVDADGLPNAQDGDSDGDGRADVTESGAINIDGDFIIDPMTDRDQDSIQDSIDADFTNGRDADADGIDDTADSDFIIEPDTDGDGIIDRLDPDADGNGYIDGTLADPGPGNEYPDFDNNGTPDFQQPLSGFVTSGVGGEGVGCVLRSSRTSDPAFPMILLFASLILLYRKHRS